MDGKRGSASVGGVVGDDGFSSHPLSDPDVASFAEVDSFVSIAKVVEPMGNFAA